MTPASHSAAYSPRLNPAHPSSAIPFSWRTALAERFTRVIAGWALSVACSSSAVASESSLFMSIPAASDARSKSARTGRALLPEVHAHAGVLGALAGEKEAVFHDRGQYHGASRMVKQTASLV